MAVIQIRLPELYPRQFKAVFDSSRHVIIEASTKSGKTFGCIVWQMSQVLTRPGHHWWVAPIGKQSDIAFNRVKKLLDPSLYQVSTINRELRFANGSVWSFKGSDNPDSLYGEDVHSAVVDEASRCKEGTWPAIRSTLTATRGPIRIIGNVKGRKNWSYKLARVAEFGRENWSYHKISAWDAVHGGILTREEILEAQRDLPDYVFRELYLAEPSDDGSNPFNLQAIDDIIHPGWKEGKAVVWGIDLAKSVDYTVAIGLDEAGNVVQFHRFQKPWRDTITYLKRITEDAPALVDSTGVGDPVLEELQANHAGNFEGFKFTPSNKQQLMEGLAIDIQSNAFRIPEGPIASELREFEYSYSKSGVRYSAPDGLHDDCVCALALARAKWRTRITSAWWI